MDSRVWMITGASSGFGLALTKAALAKGETVVACARRAESAGQLQALRSDRLSVLQLDLTEPAQIDTAVQAATDAHGPIDVLVNNAGRGSFGAVEEIGEGELRTLMNLHLFGPVRLTRAVLPQMRASGRGSIVQMSSQAGRFSLPGLGGYSASKFALEGWSEALAAEVRGFGIRVLIVEPGPFRTSFYAAGAMTVAAAMPAYEDLLGEARSLLASDRLEPPGDPDAGAALIIEALEAENPPIRLALGNEAVDQIRNSLERASGELRAWEAAGRAADR